MIHFNKQRKQHNAQHAHKTGIIAIDLCKFWNHSLQHKALGKGKTELSWWSLLQSWGSRLFGVMQRSFAPSDKVWTLHVNTISLMNSSTTITNSFGGCTQRGPNTEVSKAEYCVLQFQSWKKPLFNSCTTVQMLRTCPRLVARSTVCKRLQPSEQGYSVSLTVKFERAQPIQNYWLRNVRLQFIKYSTN